MASEIDLTICSNFEFDTIFSSPPRSSHFLNFSCDLRAYLGVEFVLEDLTCITNIFTFCNSVSEVTWSIILISPFTSTLQCTAVHQCITLQWCILSCAHYLRQIYVRLPSLCGPRHCARCMLCTTPQC